MFTGSKETVSPALQKYVLYIFKYFFERKISWIKSYSKNVFWFKKKNAD